MSKAAEEEAERYFAQLRIENARDFVIGATVYRANFDRIEEGVVRKVGRCDDPNYGEKADGKYPYYLAEFKRGRGAASGDWESQTFSWKWFATRDAARKKLRESIEGRIEDKRHDIRTLEQLLTKVGDL
jgi:hypothetical protein